MARHADENGCNSYPSVETLVTYTRKSERQVRSDVKELRKLGLIVVSVDQSPAAWIRADRRPTVYHLPMIDPVTGCSTPHVVDDTPPGPRGAVQRNTGCSTASNGVQSTAPEEDINNPRKKESAAGASSSSSTRRDDDDEDARNTKIQKRKQGQRARAKRKITKRTDADDFIADVLCDHLTDNYGAGTIDAYVDGLPDDDLHDRLAEVDWQVQHWREAANELVGKLVDRQPDADHDVLNRIGAAHVCALRHGHPDSAIYDAINAIGPTPDLTVYIDAINTLGDPAET